LEGAGAQNTAPQTAERSTVAIICGGGAFPAAVADAVLAQGRPVYLFLVKGFAEHSLERYPHEWVNIGSLAKFVGSSRKHGVKEIVIIGSSIRPRLSQLGFDWKSILLLPRLARMFLGGDNSLLSGVAKIFEENGLTVRGAHEVAPQILVPEGLATRMQPTAKELEAIETGQNLLRAIDGFDVGQAVVVAGKRIAAIEGAEGTQELLHRVAEMRRKGRLRLADREGVLVKLPKPSQDRRLDLPAIGTDTISQAKAAGLAGIAIEAHGSIVVDAQKFVAEAEAAGLFVIALPPSARRDG
jgi:DUF1009 family protein